MSSAAPETQAVESQFSTAVIVESGATGPDIIVISQATVAALWSAALIPIEPWATALVPIEPASSATYLESEERRALFGTQIRFFVRAMRDGIRGLRGKPPLHKHPSTPAFGTQLKSFFKTLRRVRAALGH